MRVVYAKQAFPDSWTSSIFLGGPTPRSHATPSWRPEALRLLEAAGYDGVVFVPEPEDGEWASNPDAYVEQVDWERRGLDVADVILFWVPREMSTMQGLTTNVEVGLYASSDKVVLGAPEWATSIRYLEHALRGETRHHTLDATIEAALTKIGERSPLRSGGERCVPLHVWRTSSFQVWYAALRAAGNRLDDARLLWHFQAPPNGPVFAWVLWASVWVEAEQRHKDNEFVLSRTDTSSVVLYRHPPPFDWRYPEDQDITDVEIVLVREFRTPARTTDGFVRELPGGSSRKEDVDPLQVASDEVHEETGLIVPAARFRSLGSRQVAATLSAHHTHLFAAELTELEMAQARALAFAEASYGVEADSERTYVEVATLRKLLAESTVDWATIGMIAQVIFCDG